MTRDALLAEFRRLPPEERLELLEELWDEFEPEELPIPDWHKEELDRCLDDPTDVANLSWERVRDSLRPPKK